MKTFLLVLCVVVSTRAFAGDVVAAGTVPGTDFIRYTGHTSSRPITFYVSQRPSVTRVPLVVWVQGTGCESHFTPREGGVWSGLLAILRSATGDRAAVLAVEKPGVQYLQVGPDKLEECPADFRRDYTLDSWAETIAAAIDMARTLPGIDSSRVLVMGHSEGGIVAIRTANVARGVTHAASLSGGGPTYLFHMAEYMRQKGLDPEQQVYGCWARVQADPDSITKFCWGQTYRQWTSFMKTSIIQEALRSEAKLYFVHGASDTQNTVAGFDVLRAELAAHARSAVFERLPGADHALDAPGQQPPDGFAKVFSRVVDWFLAGTPGPRP